MDHYSRIYTPKYHSPCRYLRVSSTPEAQYRLSLLQSVEDIFGPEEDAAHAGTGETSKTRGSRNADGDDEGEEAGRIETRESTADLEESENGGPSVIRKGVSYQRAHPATAQICTGGPFCDVMGEKVLGKCYSSFRSPVIHDELYPTRTSTLRRIDILSAKELSPTSTVKAATCEAAPPDEYSLFCEDEDALEAALEETTAAAMRWPAARPSPTASTDRATQMFSRASLQAAAPPPSEVRQQQRLPKVQHQEHPPTWTPNSQQQQREQERRLSASTPRTSEQTRRSPANRRGRGRSPGRGAGSSRRGKHRLQHRLRSYSMLDIENDAFTGVHENDVESEAGQCLRVLKTISGFCLLCIGFFLLLTCPKMRDTSPLTFYYILCTMLAEVFLALCFGCSICMLACLVGEQGAVYANATCGLLHRVAEGIIHYTLTGFGGYLLYHFREPEGVWYAAGEAEQEKFVYLLFYVGCEATISLLYSLQTLGTLFGVCRFIVIKVYSKVTGRGDVFFLHGDAPIIYASLDQYSRALRHMRNPVEIAYQRRHQRLQSEYESDLPMESNSRRNLLG